jgi:spermidine synthase
MGNELYRTEDIYGSIVVSQRGNKRVLSFDSVLEQSCVLMDKPYYLMHEYTQVMLLGLLFTEARHVTLLGLGGGGLAHCLIHYYPQITMQVVELRQAVIDIAYDWFDLPASANLQVVQDDAAFYLATVKPGKTDIIFSDLYEAAGMSTCQAQHSFFTACERALSAEGCLVLNFHKKPDPQSFLMRTIEELFNEIIIYDAGNRNCIMFCCKKPAVLHQAALNAAAEALVLHVQMPLMFYYQKLAQYK